MDSDLDSLVVFCTEGIEKSALPLGPKRIHHKGYEEIYVPGLKRKPLTLGESIAANIKFRMYSLVLKVMMLAGKMVFILQKSV